MTPYDVYLFAEGTHSRLYETFGARIDDGRVRFRVWAPDAQSVAVIGDFNEWRSDSDRLTVRGDGSGIWEGVVEGIGRGMLYKYHVVSRHHDHRADKGDPFALYWETPPRTGSIVWSLEYEWGDAGWMSERRRRNALNAPWSIYELHLGSWLRKADNGFLNYRELAPLLIRHVQQAGFTHVELLPIMEHPFYGSWGYQTTGYFAPTSRYGAPQDFMYLVDQLHQNGIGVILDWVPSHFPDDAHGLAFYDGSHLYEHADPRRGIHPEWGSRIFNYARNEVRSFLLSSAYFWFDRYHVDALRVDAVASMLYLDYGRAHGEWLPNVYGGKENLEAIEFLRQLNTTVYRDFPDVQLIAEESTAWPQVTRPVTNGGLGFGMKWNMGWMHDTLTYLARDPVHRKHHHDQLTFSIWYAFSENFVLPLSHDEVVYGKKSLVNKMPGDDWQMFANLRLLYGYMWAHPGKQLLFMGGEFAQRDEWNHEQTLAWPLLDFAQHRGVLNWVHDLNHVYREQAALHEEDFSQAGFEWLDASDSEQSVLSFLRRGKKRDDMVLVVCNFTPVVRWNHRVAVPIGGHWAEILNSDATHYGGSGQGNLGAVEAAPITHRHHRYSLTLCLPPLAVLYLQPRPREQSHE